MGATEKEHCMVDMIMEGVEGLRGMYCKFHEAQGRDEGDERGLRATLCL